MNFRLSAIYSCLLIALAWGDASGAALAPSQVIKVCGQSAEWPPYLYFKRQANDRTDEVTGYSAEYLQRSLSRKGLTYTIDMVPWKRCMESVKAGLYDMMTDTSSNSERAKTYLVSKPYYAMHLAVFFDLERPKPMVAVAADLKKYRLCGVNGYNYAVFGLSTTEMDLGSQNLDQSFQKLKHNRCDAMPERLEIALGYKTIGMADFDRLGIGFDLVPDLPLSTFHMMVSRNVPYADELLKVLNDGIEQLNNSNAAKELAAKYGINGTALNPKLSLQAIPFAPPR